MDIEFNENQGLANRPTITKAPKGITGMMIRSGLAKNPTQAGLVQVGIIVLSVLIIFAVFMFGGEVSRGQITTEGIDPVTGLPVGDPN